MEEARNRHTAGVIAHSRDEIIHGNGDFLGSGSETVMQADYNKQPQ